MEQNLRIKRGVIWALENILSAANRSCCSFRARGDALTNGGGEIGVFRGSQFLVFDRGDVDMNIDAFNQWPGDTRNITLDLRTRAITFMTWIIAVPARTGVQYQFAKRAGLDESTVSRWEREGTSLR